MSTFPAHTFESLAERCLDECGYVAQQSELADGVLRQYLSPPIKAVHELASAWMGELGMTCHTDDAGNIIGRYPTAETPTTERGTESPVVLIGSHLDTVPNAGRFDGVLGFLMGIALVRSLSDQSLPFHLDVIGFSEEEGVRFSKPYLGSHAIAGSFDLEWLGRRDASGFSLESVIRAFGLLPERIPSCKYCPNRVLAFIEPHIEQGTVLAHEGSSVGSVKAIAGQSRSLIQFIGVSAHAGTTPMDQRHDALVCAAEWIGVVSKVARAIPDCRATVGQGDISPNVRNVVPERVTLSLDLRHIDDDIRHQTVDRLYDAAREISKTNGVSFVVREEQEQPGVAMDENLQDRMKDSMHACGLRPVELISGAGHDAGVMASKFPSSILFIRQPRGISHHPDEDVEAADVADGLRVLHHFITNFDADQAVDIRKS